MSYKVGIASCFHLYIRGAFLYNEEFAIFVVRYNILGRYVRTKESQ